MNVARFSPDGRLIACATGKDALLRLYIVVDAHTPPREVAVGDFHQRAINDIAWSPTGRQLATGGEDCVVVAWRVETNPEGEITLEPRRVLRGHAAAVTSLCFNPRGTMIASGSVDEKVILWNVKGGALYKLLNAHSRPVVSVDFSYDGRLVLSASHDGYMRIWDALDGMALRILSGAAELTPILFAKFSPNSQFAVATYVTGHTRMVNVTDKINVKTYVPADSDRAEQKAGAPVQGTRELAFCRPDLLLVSTNSGVDFYNINSQERVRVFESGDTPRCIDVNETLRTGLCAGATGIKLFELGA